MDDFFQRGGTPCDRCSKKLGGFTMSWFTDAVICLDCSKKERQLKMAMREHGLDPRNYEGCGYVPSSEFRGKKGAI